MACARHSNVLQYLVIDLSEQVHVDVVALEGIRILRKADCLKPGSDIAQAATRSRQCTSSHRREF
jgi:hypothetical protein